jgi:hypothetical protein
MGEFGDAAFRTEHAALSYYAGTYVRRPSGNQRTTVGGESSVRTNAPGSPRSERRLALARDPAGWSLAGRRTVLLNRSGRTSVPVRPNVRRRTSYQNAQGVVPTGCNHLSGLHIVVEGTAELVGDEAELRMIALVLPYAIRLSRGGRLGLNQ